ncbi:MAG: ABC transporter permease [Firmicutes bacterium]|nr:ABC transporter permease [Bacillota bacterium]
MRWTTLAWKNLSGSWRRAFSVGSFTFFAGLFMVCFICFIDSVKTNMENAVINALAGEIRLAPAGAEEEDIFSLSGSWEDTGSLTKEEIDGAEQVIKEIISPVETVKRVRHNVLLISDTGETGAMILGIEPHATAYRKVLSLRAGRYIEHDYEVILTETQAESLQVGVGDILGVLAQTKAGYNIDSALTVVGIGSIDLLNLFGYNVAYTDLRSAGELLGLAEGEATDVIIYTGNPARATEIKTQLAASLTGHPIAVTTWGQTAGFIMGGLNFLSILYSSFTVILLFIIGVLLTNIISMTLLERRQEIGTLRAIGFSRWRIAWLFLLEIALLTGFFCLLGVGTGSGLVLFLGRRTLEIPPPINYFTGNHFRLIYNPVRMLPVIGIICGVTLAVAFFPVYRAAKVKPVELLQEKN